MVAPRRHNARGFTYPLRPCGPSLRPSQGPVVRLPKVVTLRRGDAATRADWSAHVNPTQNQNRVTNASKRLHGHCVLSTWNHN